MIGHNHLFLCWTGDYALCYNAGQIVFLQSRNVRVKCLLDGELPTGRKGSLLAVHIPHPAATEDEQEYLLLYAE